MKGQRGYMNDSFQLSGSSSPSLSNHEKVCKAEIMEILDSVNKNQKFFIMQWRWGKISKKLS